MFKVLLTMAMVVWPVTASAMICRAPPLVLRIALQDSACTIGDDMALRRDKNGNVECLLSDPQLRIVTLYPDGRFTYADTDDDRLLEGICTPD